MVDMTETLGRAGVTLAEALAGEADLELVTAAVAREFVIRRTMAATGQGREPVTEMIDAAASMGQEAVQELTDGEPTTLRDAVQRYVNSLEQAAEEDESLRASDVVDDLATILAYPWSGEEALIALHEPHYGLALHIDHPDDETVRVRIGANRWELYRGSYDELGSSGMGAVEKVAQAVHRAVLARVLADRPHHVQISDKGRRELMEWLARPSGSIALGRLTVDAAGNGVLFRTRPYSHQSISG